MKKYFFSATLVAALVAASLHAQTNMPSDQDTDWLGNNVLTWSALTGNWSLDLGGVARSATGLDFQSGIIASPAVSTYTINSGGEDGSLTANASGIKLAADTSANPFEVIINAPVTVAAAGINVATGNTLTVNGSLDFNAGGSNTTFSGGGMVKINGNLNRKTTLTDTRLVVAEGTTGSFTFGTAGLSTHDINWFFINDGTVTFAGVDTPADTAPGIAVRRFDGVRNDAKLVFDCSVGASNQNFSASDRGKITFNKDTRLNTISASGGTVEFNSTAYLTGQDADGNINNGGTLRIANTSTVTIDNPKTGGRNFRVGATDASTVGTLIVDGTFKVASEALGVVNLLVYDGSTLEGNGIVHFPNKALNSGATLAGNLTFDCYVAGSAGIHLKGNLTFNGGLSAQGNNSGTGATYHFGLDKATGTNNVMIVNSGIAWTTNVNTYNTINLADKWEFGDPDDAEFATLLFDLTKNTDTITSPNTFARNTSANGWIKINGKTEAELITATTIDAPLGLRIYFDDGNGKYGTRGFWLEGAKIFIPRLEVAPGSREALLGGESVIFEVSTNDVWHVAEVDDPAGMLANGAAILAAEGEGDGSIAAVVTANGTGVSRTASITVGSEGGLSETVTVTQRGEGYLALDKEGGTIFISPEGGGVEIAVESNVAWTVDTASFPAGMIVSQSASGGSGPGTFTVDFGLNGGSTDRGGTITVNDGGSLSKSVAIAQEAPVLEATLDGKDATVEGKEVLVAGETFTLAVNANVEWSAVASAGWIAISPATATGADGNATVSVTVGGNGGAHREGSIEIESAGGSVALRVPVVQGVPRLAITPKAPLPDISAAAGTYAVEIDSNLDWSLGGSFVGSQGLTLLERSGTGGKTVSFTVTANNTGKDRFGFIQASGGTGSESRTARFDFTQAPAPLVQRHPYSVYETRVTARTSAIREMNARVNRAGGGTLNVPVHFRAPVTKTYTLLMGYEGEMERAGEDYVNKGYGRMWAAGEHSLELTGEILALNGQDARGKSSLVGARGVNIPESGMHRTVRNDGANPPELTGEALVFDGVATVDPKNGNRIAGSAGFVHGEGFRPHACALANCRLPGTKSRQGDPGDLAAHAAQLIPGVYYPQGVVVDASAAPGAGEDSPAHFLGTYTTRYNKKLADDAARLGSPKAAIDADLARRRVSPRP